MTWTAVSTALTPNNQWQFTAPVEGEFFRLKHTRSPNEPKAWICQAEKLEDDSYQIFDVQPIHANNLAESFQLKKPAIFTNRCVGFRYAVDYNSPWVIALEVSDVTSRSVSPNTASTSKNRDTQRLDPLSYTASALENYTYYPGNYTLAAINDNDLTNGTIKTDGGASGYLKVLATFPNPVYLNKLTVYTGQFNGNYNSPQKLEVYAGSSDTGNALLSSNLDISNGTTNLDTTSNTAFNNSSNQYTFVFSNSTGGNNISVRELDLFGEIASVTSN